jgi:hypothetical protein
VFELSATDIQTRDKKNLVLIRGIKIPKNEKVLSPKRRANFFKNDFFLKAFLIYSFLQTRIIRKKDKS